MDDSPQHSTNVSPVFITKDTVDDARMTLPLAQLVSYEVMQVEVMSANGSPAMIEFERIRTFDESGQCCWTWKATTCCAA